MSGTNKPYFLWEKKLIIELRRQGHSWENLTLLYNSTVEPDRQRSEKTLRAQYKFIQQYELELLDNESDNESDAEGEDDETAAIPETQ